jgi:hypothetical protein
MISYNAYRFNFSTINDNKELPLEQFTTHC